MKRFKSILSSLNLIELQGGKTKMRIVEYNGLKYEINLEELNQLKKDSSRPKGVKLQEGWTNAIDVMIKIWDNGGKELFLYVAKKLIEKVIKNRKPLD